MKSTPFYEGDQVTYVGEASDRVNLWPVAYWRNPVGSVLWPLTSFSDDHFAFRPIYSQYKQSRAVGAWDEYNFLWPLAQADTKHDDYRVFPVFWGWDGTNYAYQAVFPLYWNGHDYNAFFPLWYKGEKAFVSPLYARGEDGGKGWWAAPAALSWGDWRQGAKDTRSEGTVLLGLGHWYSSRNEEGLGYCSWHAFPFVARTVNEKNKDDGVRKTRKETHAACYLFGRTTLEDKTTSCYVFPFFGWSDNGDWWTPLCGQICSGYSWDGDMESVTNTFRTHGDV